MAEILVYSIIYLTLFGLTDLLYHRGGIKVDVTRKIVHVCTGIIAFTFPLFLQHIWQLTVLCGSFLILMFASEKAGWFKSITAVERRSHGSWLFALSVLVCFIVNRLIHQQNNSFYYIPLLLLTLADPAAAYFGKRLKSRTFTIHGSIKTLGGSLAFFLVSVIVLLIYFNWQGDNFTQRDWPHSFIQIILLSIAASSAEFFSVHGWDNLTIPLAVLVALLIL